MHPVITNNTYRPLDSEQHVTTAALHRLNALSPVCDALAALGIDHLVSVHPIDAARLKAPGSVYFSLNWPLRDDRRAQATWTASVKPLDVDRSLLSVSVTVYTNDRRGSDLARTAWPLLSPVLESITTTLIKRVAELAERLVEEDPESVHALSAAA